MIDSLKKITEIAIGKLIGGLLLTLIGDASFIISLSSYREFIATTPWPFLALILFGLVFLIVLTSFLFYAILYSSQGLGVYSSRYLKWYTLPVRKLSWDFGNFLGVSRSNGNPITVNTFQSQFKINWGEGISPIKAFLECKRTGMKQDVVISALDAYSKAEDIEFIPAGKWFQCQSLFGDISKEDFLQKYDGFRFVFEYDNKVFSKTFSREELETYLDRFSKYTSPRPEPRGTLRN